MAGVNKAIILGRLGADPEIRFTASGKAVCNFSVATDAVWKDRDGQQQKHTEWHRIQVWGAQAESCSKYLSKGREVYIEGEIRTREYDDKDGVTRRVTEIVARDVKFLGGGQGGEGDGRQQRGGRGRGRDDDYAPPTDDDVPF